MTWLALASPNSLLLISTQGGKFLRTTDRKARTRDSGCHARLVMRWSPMHWGTVGTWRLGGSTPSGLCWPPVPPASSTPLFCTLLLERHKYKVGCLETQAFWALGHPCNGSLWGASHQAIPAERAAGPWCHCSQQVLPWKTPLGYPSYKAASASPKHTAPMSTLGPGARGCGEVSRPLRPRLT